MPTRRTRMEQRAIREKILYGRDIVIPDEWRGWCFEWDTSVRRSDGRNAYTLHRWHVQYTVARVLHPEYVGIDKLPSPYAQDPDKLAGAKHRFATVVYDRYTGEIRYYRVFSRRKIAKKYFLKWADVLEAEKKQAVAKERAKAARMYERSLTYEKAKKARRQK